jgi:hypothetical protein
MYTSTTRRQRRSGRRSGPAAALGEAIGGDGGLGAVAVLEEPVGAMGDGRGGRRGRRQSSGGVLQGRRGGRPAVWGGAGPVGEARRRRWMGLGRRRTGQGRQRTRQGRRRCLGQGRQRTGQGRRWCLGQRGGGGGWGRGDGGSG